MLSKIKKAERRFSGSPRYVARKPWAAFSNPGYNKSNNEGHIPHWLTVSNSHLPSLPNRVQHQSQPSPYMDEWEVYTKRKKAELGNSCEFSAYYNIKLAEQMINSTIRKSKTNGNKQHKEMGKQDESSQHHSCPAVNVQLWHSGISKGDINEMKYKNKKTTTNTKGDVDACTWRVMRATRTWNNLWFLCSKTLNWN